MATALYIKIKPVRCAHNDTAHHANRCLARGSANPPRNDGHLFRHPLCAPWSEVFGVAGDERSEPPGQTAIDTSKEIRSGASQSRLPLPPAAITRATKPPLHQVADGVSKTYHCVSPNPTDNRPLLRPPVVNRRLRSPGFDASKKICSLGEPGKRYKDSKNALGRREKEPEPCQKRGKRLSFKNPAARAGLVDWCCCCAYRRGRDLPEASRKNLRASPAR